MDIICFAYPGRLAALLLLLPLAGVLAWGMWKKIRARRRLADEKLAESLFGGWGLRSEVSIRMAQFFAAGFLLIAWCGPQLCSGERLVRREALDVVYVLDVSNSMLARDVVPDRLRRAKQEMLKISRGSDRGRKGLVAFAGSAVIQCPLTADQQAFEMMLNAASPDFVEVQGTNLNEALDLAGRMFSARSRAESAAGVRIVVLVSDGENHGKGFSGEARRLKEKDIQLIVIGVGRQEPAVIPFQDAGSVKRDAEGNPVLTSFRPDLLGQLAEDAGGIFLHSHGAEPVTDRVLEHLGKMETGKQWIREPRYREDIYQYFVLLSVVMLLGAGFLSVKI